MQKRVAGIILCWVFVAIGTAAQNTFPASGNVGIGTTNPNAALAVKSPGINQFVSTVLNSNSQQIFGIWDQNNGASTLEMRDWSQTPTVTISTTSNSWFNGGNVGIGTTLPLGIFQISEPNQSIGNWINFYNNVGISGGNPPAAMNAGVILGWNASGGVGESEILYGTGLGSGPRLDFGRWSGTGRTIDMSLNAGNVGIGTTSPAYKLDVAGPMRVQGGGIVYPDGNTQSAAWTGSLCGGDYAESIDVSDDRARYEPGDVLVIDPNIDGKFVKSSESYATSVAGIYSTKPGVVGRRQTTQKNPDEIPMAVIGIVPVKVSTENGSIRRGDILVTSSIPGYAMKGTDRSRMFQAVVGKAMASLESGTGTIEVLVSLQ